MTPHPKRVLCVEDEEDTCLMISALLGLINCEAVSAQTIDAARQQIRKEQFDLYLLDNWLPGGTGIELCREIREQDTTTPVIFYSGAAYDSDRQEAMEAGAQAYLIKPTDIARLIEVVKLFLKAP
jgi:DNA-binding response OmpR family regulator